MMNAKRKWGLGGFCLGVAIVGMLCKYAELYTSDLMQRLTLQGASGEELMAALRRWSSLLAIARPLPLLLMTAFACLLALLYARGDLRLPGALGWACGAAALYAAGQIPLLFIGGESALPAAMAFRSAPWMLARAVVIILLGAWLARLAEKPPSRLFWGLSAALLAAVQLTDAAGLLSRGMSALTSGHPALLNVWISYRDSTRLSALALQGTLLPVLLLGALTLLCALCILRGSVTLRRAALIHFALLWVYFLGALPFLSSWQTSEGQMAPLPSHIIRTLLMAAAAAIALSAARALSRRA